MSQYPSPLHLGRIHLSVAAGIEALGRDPPGYAGARCTLKLLGGSSVLPGSPITAIRSKSLQWEYSCLEQ